MGVVTMMLTHDLSKIRHRAYLRTYAPGALPPEDDPAADAEALILMVEELEDEATRFVPKADLEEAERDAAEQASELEEARAEILRTERMSAAVHAALRRDERVRAALLTSAPSDEEEDSEGEGDPGPGHALLAAATATAPDVLVLLTTALPFLEYLRTIRLQAEAAARAAACAEAQRVADRARWIDALTRRHTADALRAALTQRNAPAEAIAACRTKRALAELYAATPDPYDVARAKPTPTTVPAPTAAAAKASAAGAWPAPDAPRAAVDAYLARARGDGA